MPGSTITSYKRSPNDQEFALELTTSDSYHFKRRLYHLRMGWALRDVLAHGVFDYHPAVTGTATHVADHMQNWLGADACDGISLAIDSYHDRYRRLRR